MFSDYPVETSSALQTKSFALTETVLDFPLAVSPHRSLNSSRGVISKPDRMCTSEKEILEGFLIRSRCRNCGGGDRGRVAIYRPFGELRRAKIVLSPVWCSRPTTGVPLAHATMNFVGLDLTASDRWHQKTTTTTT
ncbi:hypothetical protein TNCV_1884041 [Trichonephila clavipes]|nr:hypothetical protein TNCV_1884041 [Trichonephila clavipes]